MPQSSGPEETSTDVLSVAEREDALFIRKIKERARQCASEAEIQALLYDLGFYDGPIDGCVDDRTHDAFEAFQYALRSGTRAAFGAYQRPPETPQRQVADTG